MTARTGAVVPAPALLDLRRSPALDHELPGFRAALDADAMRHRLQAVLVGPAGATTIERCSPGPAVFLGGTGTVRYRLELGHPRGRPGPALVTARLFADHRDLAAHLRERAEPLAARVAGREEVAPFAAPVVTLDDLQAVVEVYPVDAELPTLADASDPARMGPVLRALPAVAAAGPAHGDCRVERRHYGRRHRCVLRYELGGSHPGGPGPLVIYGKVAGDDRGALAGPVTDGLRRLVAAGAAPSPFAVPRAMGFLPELRLALLEEIAGVPRVAQVLGAALGGEPAPAGLTLDQGLDACAHVAAAVHTSGIEVGPARTFDDDVDRLRAGVSLVERLSPGLGARLGAWLADAERGAAGTVPLEPGLAHGDFTLTQLVFDGPRSGLVDFDTVCRAEPALDLGQFLAYLRLAVGKADPAPGPGHAALADRLCSRFLDTYLAASGAAADAVAPRAGVHEVLSLLRLAVHSWQKLKVGRLGHALGVLEQRAPRLAAGGGP